jgi:hypothetical protein
MNIPRLNIDAYLKHYGISFKKLKDGPITVYNLKECVFDKDHGEWEVSILKSSPSSIISYNCSHKSCIGKTWKEVRYRISGSDPIIKFLIENPNL